MEVNLALWVIELKKLCFTLHFNIPTVNPNNLEQANVKYLTEHDFEYIKKVSALVEKRLRNSDWLEKTLDIIGNKFYAKKTTVVGIKFDNELFKVGRGILESYLIELERNANNTIQ